MKDTLLILKRKCATLRSNTTRCATAINDSTDATTSDDLEYYRNRLQESLDQLTSLDDTIHASLNDTEYATDVENCEVYIDSAKRAIYKATRAIDNQL
jgi:3-methyladenine DNA glycosylase AlkC